MRSTEEATNYGPLYVSVCEQIQDLTREIIVLRHKQNQVQRDTMKAFYEKTITSKKETLQNLIETRRHIEKHLF